MKTPIPVKKMIVHFRDEYVENPSLRNFTRMHLQPRTLTYPEGQPGSRYISITIYNETEKQKRWLGENYASVFFCHGVNEPSVSIFADRSTVITFRHLMTFVEETYSTTLEVLEA